MSEQSKAVAKAKPGKSILVTMADQYGMEPEAFEQVVRATCMPPDRNGKVPSKAEFASFLLVAKEYDLNPLTKEIYAFSGKGGGVVPILSIDGWVSLIQKSGKCDGFEFEFEHTDDGSLVSCTCTMYRKDQKHPTRVTEYLSECRRPTDPWKMAHRMLRHKSLMQAGRYAFGYSGIYDEDEARDIIRNETMRDVTPSEPPEPPPPPPPPTEPPQPVEPEIIDVEPEPPTIDDAAAEIAQEYAQMSNKELIKLAREEVPATCPDEDSLYDLWLTYVVDREMDKTETNVLKAIFAKQARALDLPRFLPDESIDP